MPGNDDQAAMATVLIWHLLGLYPGSQSNSKYIETSLLIGKQISAKYIRNAHTITLHAQIHHPQYILKYINDCHCEEL